MKQARAARTSKPRPSPDVEDELEDFDDTDALIMAAMQGNEEAVSVLIESGVSIDHKDSIGVAPLHWSAFCGHSRVTQQLIVAGADIHVQDREGRTPLHVAAYENQQDCMRVLMAARADLHAPDKAGWTPLHCAVSNAVEPACRLLVEGARHPRAQRRTPHRTHTPRGVHRARRMPAPTPGLPSPNLSPPLFPTPPPSRPCPCG